MLLLKSSHNEQRDIVCLFVGKRTNTPVLQSKLGPSDYHLSVLMKKMLVGQKFASDTEVQSVIRQWLVQ